MSGSGRKVFQPGEVLTASNVQNYLQDQAVMVFAGTAARGSALGAGTVSDGMMSYLQDTNTVEVYKTTGTAIAGWEAPYPISPNVVINGDFSINQRNFSSTTTSDAYGFDRWLMHTSGGLTYSAQTFTPGTAPVAGYEAANYARLVTSGQSAAGSYSQFEQRIEDVRTFAGQTVTISFWARAASGTPKVAVSFWQIFGSGGSPSAGVYTYANQVTLSTSWARYSVTTTVPSIAGKTIGTTANTSFLDLLFWVSAGSTFNADTGSIGIQNNTIDFWGIQLEAGQTATPFRRNAPSIQAELAACQRYYYRIADSNANYTLFGIGQAYTSTNARIAIQVPSTMRVKPTAIEWTGTIGNYTISSTAGWSTITSMNISAVPNSAYTPTIELVGTGFTNGQTFMLLANNNTSAYLGVTAEL